MDNENLSLKQDQNYNNLTDLINELVSDTPNEKKVRELMELAGLEYTTDQITRMNQVLQLLHKK